MYLLCVYLLPKRQYVSWDSYSILHHKNRTYNVYLKEHADPMLDISLEPICLQYIGMTLLIIWIIPTISRILSTGKRFHSLLRSKDLVLFTTIIIPAINRRFEAYVDLSM